MAVNVTETTNRKRAVLYDRVSAGDCGSAAEMSNAASDRPKARRASWRPAGPEGATKPEGECKLKSKCTRSKDGRRITRWVYEEVLEEMEARVQDEPDKVRLRKTMAEHPFGAIKRHMDQGYFLMRGLQNVEAEMSLTVLAYNIKRANKILGVPKMVQALAQVGLFSLSIVSYSISQQIDSNLLRRLINTSVGRHFFYGLASG